MPGKILWLTMAVTLAYWLGSAGGCANIAEQEDQNYKTLEEDRSPFETRHDVDKPGAAAPSEEQPVQTAGAPVAPVEETGPSLNGIDRSHWPVQVTSSSDGAAPFQQHYFNDLPLDPADAYGDSPLDGAVAAGMDKTNTIALVAQPFKFAFDVAVMPFAVLTNPPRDQDLRIPGDWGSSASAPQPVSAEAAPSNETE